MLDIGTTLDKAKNIIIGARQDSYGKPHDSFTRIAEMWDNYLYHKAKALNSEKKDLVINRCDVAIMMILLKIAREINCHSTDNLTDICGYADLYNYIYENPHDS